MFDKGWDVKGASSHGSVPSTRTNLVWLHQVKGHKTEQHHDRCGKGVDEELLRSVPAVFPTPIEDEEEHWNERQFPEHIEHEQVKGYEDTDQCTAHQQNGWEVGCTVFLMPGCDDGHRQQEGGQPNHWERQGIKANRPMDTEGREPLIGIVQFVIVKRQTIACDVSKDLKEHPGGVGKQTNGEGKACHSNRVVEFVAGGLVCV